MKNRKRTTKFKFSDSDNEERGILMPKVLIFGGTGMVGNVVSKHFFNCGYDVTITTRGKVPKWFPSSRPASVVYFDAALSALPDLEPFDFIINCISAEESTKDTKNAYLVNAMFPYKVAITKNTSAKFFNISTEQVFSGLSKTPYSVNGVTDAEHTFGASKSAGEALKTISVRCGLVGPSENPNRGFINQITSSDKAKITYCNDTWSGVTTLFLAEFLESFCLYENHNSALIDKGMIIHLACPAIKKEKLFKSIAKIYGTSKTFVANKEEPRNFELVPNVSFAPQMEEQLELLKEWSKTNL